jgi:TonB family protein
MRGMGTSYFVVFLLFCALSPAQDLKSIEKDLSALKGKYLVLREAYDESQPSFDEQGQHKGKAAPAPVSLNGVFVVTSLKVRAAQLEIKGERASLFIDKRSRTVQGVRTGEEIKVRIDSAAGFASLDQAKSSLERVFHDASYLDLLRSTYWKQLLPEGKDYDEARKKGQPIGILIGNRPVYSVSPGTIEPPRPVFTPDPEYSQDAREKKVTGTSVWRLYLNERGQPEILEMGTSLEKTLDLRAVDALRRWRFKPATKSGIPVACRVDVEVSFRLY